MKDIIWDKKIIIVWLWQQWMKLINFLTQEKLIANIVWVCKSSQTQDKISTQYNIPVSRDYISTIQENLGNIAFIFIWVKPENKQEKIYLDIYNSFPQEAILIEKSYIWAKYLEKLYKDNPNHAIIQNELWHLDFFKNLPQDIKGIKIFAQPNKKIFEDIITNKVFLLSYCFDYIGMLSFEKAPEVISSQKINDSKYMIQIIANTIKIEIYLESKNLNIANDSVIYTHTSGQKSIFNRYSPHVIIADKKVANLDQSNSIFKLCVREKIIQLSSKNNNLRMQIVALQNFRILNQINKHIHYN